MVQISIQDTTRESKVRTRVFNICFFSLKQSVNMQFANIWPWFLQTCYGTNSPIWSDAFTFFIQDPRKQDIDIQVSLMSCSRFWSPVYLTQVSWFFVRQVKDDDRSLSLGTLTVPLMRLLGSPELTMDQWFQLENSGSASRIYVKIVLRVCVSLPAPSYQKQNYFRGNWIMREKGTKSNYKCREATQLTWLSLNREDILESGWS